MFEIGNWVRRVYADPGRYVTGKWHLVDSVVAGAAFTNCGRRLEPHTSAKVENSLEVSEVKPLTRLIGQPQNCQQCDPA